MYKLSKICSPPYFPNRIDKISELRNFVKVGGGVPQPPNTLPSYGPGCSLLCRRCQRALDFTTRTGMITGVTERELGSPVKER